MCGITGIINKTNKEVSKEEIKKMNDLIIHRGPDDEGYYFGENFAFGHRRLSIVDLSEAGHQPMEYKGKNGEYVITYNGEVYNYIELREELKKEGYEFKSDTDTEVILASYDKWGADSVKKFNGMWAFAIFDKYRNIIFCSRDRFGIKPFYYTRIDDKFLFGSEIKQFLEFLPKRFVNKKILLDYLVFGLEEHTNETFFKNIYKLDQAHNLIYDLSTHTFNKFRYYELDIKENQKSEQETVILIRDKLINAIKLRLRSDVKVGTCLSGGLDSSAITAIASKLYRSSEKFHAIHAKSVEKKTDESKFAKTVASYCDLELNIVEPSLEDIKNYIEEVVHTQEEPFGGPSIFMQYFVFKRAKEIGCKVMLDGQGGDEVFFGYESYYSIYFAELIKQFKINEFLKEYKKLQTFKVKKINVLRNAIIHIFRERLWFFEKIYRQKKLQLKVEIDSNPLKGFKSLKMFQKSQIEQYNLPKLLRYEDKNSMRHSVESRVPFVDYNVVVSGINSRDNLKFKNGYLKYFLRKVIENYLPKKIVWRKNKFGFEAPTDMWIEKYKKFMMVEIKKSNILKEIVEIDDNLSYKNSILWRMFNISIWEKIYKIDIEKNQNRTEQKRLEIRLNSII